MNGAAARMAARLRALSARERLLLLVSGVAVLIVLAARFLVDPAVAEYRRNRNAIPARLEMLERYRLAAGGTDRVEEALAEAVARLEAAEEGLLPGDHPSAAGVSLQGLLKPMADRPDTRVTSVRGLAPVGKGAYAEVAVQVDLQTTTEGLASILAAVPRSPKLLRVRKVNVSSGYYGAAMASRRETLMASIVVSGLARAAGDERPAEGREGAGE